MRRKDCLVLLFVLAACARDSGSSSRHDEGVDLSISDLQSDALPSTQPDGDAADLEGVDQAMQPDLAPSVATGVDCFYDWGSTPGCAAPVITSAYLTDDCAGSSGVYFIGHGFEQQHIGGIAGPGVLFSNGSSESLWSFLTPDVMCVVTPSDPSWWGITATLTNPDGQTSNTITVQDLLSAPPPLPSTDSTVPFDTDACLEPEMLATTALTFFQTGASTAALASLPLYKRSRNCNSSSGCAAFSATTIEETAAFSFSTSAGVHLEMDNNDCGVLPITPAAEPLAYNSCTAATGGSYEVHVADHCISVNTVAATLPDSSQNYVETDYAGVVRF